MGLSPAGKEGLVPPRSMVSLSGLGRRVRLLPLGTPAPAGAVLHLGFTQPEAEALKPNVSYILKL